MRCTLDNAQALLPQNLPIRLVSLLTLFSEHITLEHLSVHIAHTTKPLLAIALPSRLAYNLSFSIIWCNIPLFLNTFGARDGFCLVIKPLEDLIISANRIHTIHFGQL